VPILKLLAKAEEIAGSYRLYRSEKLRVQEEIYEKITSKNDPLLN
jgi:hypothetical protein